MYRKIPQLRFALAALTLSVHAAAQIPITVQFNPNPRRLTQTEWIQPAYPSSWGAVLQNSSHVSGTIFLRSGASAFAGQNGSSLPASELVHYLSFPMSEPHRFAYRPGPALSGTISFFISATNTQNSQTAVTSVGVVNLSRTIDGPVAEATGFFDNDPLIAPTPLNLPWADGVADVYVDIASGSDQNSGSSIGNAVKTLDKGLSLLQGMGTQVGSHWEIPGKVMLVNGGTYAFRNDSLQRLDIPKFKLRGRPGNPFVVAGAAGSPAVLDGFSFDYQAWINDPSVPRPTDPYSFHDSGIPLEGTRDAVIENFTSRGWRRDGCKPDNTRRVWLRFLNIHNVGKWGIHALSFGDVIEDLVIEGCRVRGTLDFSGPGQDEHGIYIAGAGTEVGAGGLRKPLTRRIRISYNQIWHTARHCIQVNGCQENVLINNNRLLQASFGGIQCTLTPNLRIVNNVVAECMRTPIIIFSDFDRTFWPERYGASVQSWKENHFQAIGNIEIGYNTLYVPSAEWTPRSITSGPADFEAIRFAENSDYETTAAGQKVEALVEPFFNVNVHDNLLVSQSRQMLVYRQSSQLITVNGNQVPIDEFSRARRMLEGVSFTNNHWHAVTATTLSPETYAFCWTDEQVNPQGICLATPDMTLASLGTVLPTQWSSNKIHGAPHFRHLEPIVCISSEQWWPIHDDRMLRSDFNVAFNSPVVDMGSSPFPPVDTLNVARPRGAGPDIGAHESH